MCLAKLYYIWRKCLLQSFPVRGFCVLLVAAAAAAALLIVVVVSAGSIHA